ncbi:MAG: hypothetical protein CMP22_01655 [Rickettsiales bacterium]|nr:hypothetical protein [Rickettsiales bacterium]
MTANSTPNHADFDKKMEDLKAQGFRKMPLDEYSDFFELLRKAENDTSGSSLDWLDGYISRLDPPLQSSDFLSCYILFNDQKQEMLIVNPKTLDVYKEVKPDENELTENSALKKRIHKFRL